MGGAGASTGALGGVGGGPMGIGGVGGSNLGGSSSGGIGGKSILQRRNTLIVNMSICSLRVD